jgi:hypothetical protein
MTKSIRYIDEVRECRYPLLDATLNELERSLTDPYDLAGAAGLQVLFASKPE